MTLKREEVEKIADLARLKIADQEIDSLVSKLSNIIGFVEQLGEADTDSVAPMAHPLSMSQRLRADEVTEINRRDEFQSNAPAIEGGLYLVPKVIE